MDKLSYKRGALAALRDEGFIKEALPLWAYPAAAGAGALFGAATGETPGIGALQGAVLAPAALLGGHAAWRHMAKASPAMRGLATGAGGAAAGLGTYGLGRAGAGWLSDMIRAPGRAEEARKQQLTQMMQARQANPYGYYPQQADSSQYYY